VAATLLRLHDLEVNLDTRAAWRAAVKLELTMREFDLLGALCHIEVPAPRHG
jgi:DNA-binding response OmpR family regulator